MIKNKKKRVKVPSAQYGMESNLDWATMLLRATAPSQIAATPINNMPTPNVQQNVTPSGGGMSAAGIAGGLMSAAPLAVSLLASPFLKSTATSGGEAAMQSVLGIAQGMGTGVQIGSMFGPMGAVIGGAAGAAVGLVGKKGEEASMTSFTDYDEGTLGTGLIGAFTNRRLRRKREKMKINALNNRAAVSGTEYLRNEYAEENGDMDTNTFATGGVIPSSLAYVDDGELISTPDGNVGKVPERGRPTDSNLIDLPEGSKILSNTLKVPGTKKTFAELGEEMMTKRKSKGKDRFAENANKLNELNNKKIHDALFAQQENLKAEKGIKPKSKAIPAYDDGGDTSRSALQRLANTAPWAFLSTTPFGGLGLLSLLNNASDLSEIGNSLRLPEETSQSNTSAIDNDGNIDYSSYTPDYAGYNRYTDDLRKQRGPISRAVRSDSPRAMSYSDFVNTVNSAAQRKSDAQQQEQRLANLNSNPAYQEASKELRDAVLNRDFRYPLFPWDTNLENWGIEQTWSKGLQSPWTYTSTVDLPDPALYRPAGSGSGSASVSTRVATPAASVPVATTTTPPVIENITDPIEVDHTVEPTITAGNTSRQTTEDPKNPRWMSTLGDVASGLASLTPILSNLFTSSPETVRANYNPYASTIAGTMRRRRYDINPIMRDIARNRAISDYNASQFNTNTGSNMAYRLQSAIAANRAIADARSTENNVNNQYLSEYANTLNNLGQQFVAANNLAEDLNAQNRAAARNIRRTGMSQLSSWAQNRELMRNQRNRDKAMFELYRPLIQSVTPAENYEQWLQYINR